MRLSTLCISLCFCFSLFLFASCNYHAKNENKENLNKAGMLLETNAEQALSLLKAVDVGLLDKQDYEYFILVQVHAWAANGVSVASSDTSVVKAKDYFVQTQNAAKAAYAYFVLGRVFIAKNDLASALYNYEQADEWAQKAEYNIPNIPYSRIPYNISRTYYNSRKYQESLHYAKEARKYIATEEDEYKNELHAVELMALDFQYLGYTDSSLNYYNQAILLAETHNDELSKNRLYYNVSTLLYRIKDYAAVKEKCKEALARTPVNDSITTGRLYAVLGAAYNATGNIDSAYVNIYKAESLLAKAEPVVKAFLYTTLANVERNRGNREKVDEYTNKYEQLKAEQIQKETGEAARLQALLKKEQDAKIAEVLLLSEKTHGLVERQSRTIFLIIISLFLMAFILAFLVHKTKKSAMDNREDYVREIKEYKNEIEFLRYGEKKAAITHIFQRRDMIRLIDWVQEHYEKNDMRNELVYSIEDIMQNNPWHMKDYYKAMFENISYCFPSLDENEYRMLCLMCTETMTVDEVADFLNMPYDEFEEVKSRLEYKVLNTDINTQDMDLIGERVYTLLLISRVKKTHPNFMVNDVLHDFLPVKPSAI